MTSTSVGQTTDDETEKKDDEAVEHPAHAEPDVAEHVAKVNTDAVTKGAEVAQHVAKANTDAATKTGQAVERAAKVGTAAATKGGQNVERIAKVNTDAMTKGGQAVEQMTKTHTDAMIKGSHVVEQMTKTNTEAMAKGTQKVEEMTKANTEAVTKSGNAAVSGLHDLAEAYQSLASQNAERLTASLQALASVKSPAEFIELQQKMMSEAVTAAISDSSKIAKLTAEVFAAALEPMRNQIRSL